MVDQFLVFLRVGFSHISDIKGFDHILFIVTLCSIYRLSDWKKVTILVTAFTLGHSITLALAAMHIIVPNTYLVELLIPVTILVTSIYNLIQHESDRKHSLRISYILALSFGFIHGLGFSNFFNRMMGDGMNIAFPLFSFNLGLELGQLLIVGIFLSTYFTLNKITAFQHRSWTIFFSGAGSSLAILLILQRI